MRVKAVRGTKPNPKRTSECCAGASRTPGRTEEVNATRLFRACCATTQVCARAKSVRQHFITVVMVCEA